MFGILRTVLAIYVVLLHIFSVPVLGNYAVSFFFLLSGFLMTYIMHETYGYTLRGFGVFWLNRFLRLYPIYFFIILITVVFVVLLPDIIRNPHLFIPKTFSEWFTNITMLFPNIVPHRYIPRVVPTSWALTNELFFYLLISLGISKTKKRTYIWLLLSILYFVGTYLYYDIATYRYSAIPAASLPFSLGACLFWSIKNKRVFNTRISIITISFIFFNINAVSSIYLPFYLKEATIYINMILAMLLVYLLFNYRPKKPLKILDDTLGAYSYPIYLSHYLLALVYSGYIGYGVIPDSFKMNFLAIIPFFFLLFLFCFLIVQFLDKKINSFKKKIKKQHLV